jgi:hypothetical protein
MHDIRASMEAALEKLIIRGLVRGSWCEYEVIGMKLYRSGWNVPCRCDLEFV